MPDGEPDLKFAMTY